jgi:hypothetical protein
MTKGSDVGFVYLLTHDAMPDLTKIGRTDASVEERMRSLNNTSVPYGFKCFYAAEVRDPADVERRLHAAFEDFHIGKEFFDVHPIRIQKVLEMVALRDATPREEVILDADEAEQLSKNEQRPHLRRFSMFRIGLKVGDQLVFARDESLTATVASDTELDFDGEVRSISASALAAIKKCGYDWKTIPGPVFWMHKNQSLKEIESERFRGS